MRRRHTEASLDTHQGRVLLGGTCTRRAPERPLCTASQQVVEQHRGPREGGPTAAAPEGLLRSSGAPWLLATGAGPQGCLVVLAPAWLPIATGGPVLQVAWYSRDVFPRLSTQQVLV